MIIWWVLGILLAYAWTWRLFDAARGMRTLPDLAAPNFDRTPSPAPRVSFIIPARNEQSNIAATLASALALDYPNYEVIAVNDRSTDATAACMAEVQNTWQRTPPSAAPQLNLIHIEHLPPGWLGKPHAMWIAAQQAAGDWLLFTDADVTFRPDVLRRAIAFAETGRADHLILPPSYARSGAGKTMMLAGFMLIFVWGHRPWAVADPRAPDWIGLGAFNLIRRSAYERIGGWQALRMEILDDMKLGKLVKRHGLAQRVALGRELLSCEWAHGAAGVVHVLTKNMFALMGYRWGKALAALALFLGLNLLPFVGTALAPGWAKAPFALALASIFAMYVGLGARTGISPAYFLTHPFSTLTLAYTMLRSMAHVARYRGVIWRGTRYGLDELRRGLV